ncbi:hypothetical protein ACERK3_05725 [Phycisphaerales bacterium AB-hyl4]|uniref:Secreted protein n=1 Tax=Natronomicrosphaera hydrolytica TaxID=3242702 RepID=A0ABV4U4Y0_9BACT
MDLKVLLTLPLCVALSGAGLLADEADAPADESTIGANESGVSNMPRDGLDLLRDRESPAVEPFRGPTIGGTGPRVDVDPAVVGLPPGEAVPRARREGDFLVNQPGRVLRPDDGSLWIFQPTVREDEEAEADALPPMLVLPSGRLEMIETYMQEQGGDAWFEVSGRIHAYRGVNYLLLTQARPRVSAEAQSTDEGDESAEQAEAVDEDEDPMLRALLEQRQAAPSTPREQATTDRPRDRAAVVAGSAPGSGEAAGETLRDEGSMLVQRRGRVTRARDGGHVLFTFEADGRESPESPMILQPCRLMESMERIVQQRGEQVLFVVSGQVQRYRGANYLLPTMMRVSPEKGNLGR